MNVYNLFLSLNGLDTQQPRRKQGFNPSCHLFLFCLSVLILFKETMVRNRVREQNRDKGKRKKGRIERERIRKRERERERERDGERTNKRRGGAAILYTRYNINAAICWGPPASAIHCRPGCGDIISPRRPHVIQLKPES